MLSSVSKYPTRRPTSPGVEYVPSPAVAAFPKNEHEKFEKASGKKFRFRGKLLKIEPATERQIMIKEPLSFRATVLRNQIWYRGDPAEMEQFFKAEIDSGVAKVAAGLDLDYLRTFARRNIPVKSEYPARIAENIKNMYESEKTVR